MKSEKSFSGEKKRRKKNRRRGKKSSSSTTCVCDPAKELESLYFFLEKQKILCELTFCANFLSISEARTRVNPTNHRHHHGDGRTNH